MTQQQTAEILVLYSTATGTARQVAKRLHRQLTAQRWHAQVKDTQRATICDLFDFDFVVFVTATAGQGDAPASFVRLWQQLTKKSLAPDALDGLNFAVFGLGDSSYAQYNFVAKKLFRRLTQLGAAALTSLGLGDDQNEFGVESSLPAFIGDVLAAIARRSSSALASQSTPLARQPPRVERIERLDRAQVATQAAGVGGVGCASSLSLSFASSSRLSGRRWFQDARLFEFNERVTAQPAQSIEIQPKNSAAAVDVVLESFGWREASDVVCDFVPTAANDALDAVAKPTTIRKLLTEHFDLNQSPDFNFFECLSWFAEGEVKAKLEWFCSPEGVDDRFEYAQQPRRTIAETIHEFRQVKVPVEFIFDLLPPIQARLYSVASAPDEPLALFVAVVDFQTKLSARRTGLATAYLTSLQPGDVINAQLTASEFVRVPDDAPLVCVGAGTGVAPLRSVVRERAKRGVGDNFLFFGCRSSEEDCYFKEEWAEFAGRGLLRFFVAVSREGAREYVQAQLSRERARVWCAFERGAFFFVCGSSGAMPAAVERAVIDDVFCSAGGLSAVSGRALWASLVRCKRIVIESW